jgi:hypothetical protein
MTDRGKDDRLEFVHWGAEIPRSSGTPLRSASSQAPQNDRMGGWMIFWVCALGCGDSSGLNQLR